MGKRLRRLLPQKDGLGNGALRCPHACDRPYGRSPDGRRLYRRAAVKPIGDGMYRCPLCGGRFPAGTLARIYRARRRLSRAQLDDA